MADEAFERRERLAAIVDKMTYADWLTFVTALLSTQEASLIQSTDTIIEDKSTALTTEGVPNQFSNAKNKQQIIYYR